MHAVPSKPSLHPTLASRLRRLSSAGELERYPDQRLLVVAWDAYAYLVPYVEEAEDYFLKTVIPSRKATRDYLTPGDPDDAT